MARNKLTQKEMVARYLAKKIYQWVPGHEIVRNAATIIGKDYILQDGDTRAHDLVREGTFNSSHFTYFFESRRNGKYTEFRISKKEPRFVVNGRRNFTMEALYA